MKMGDEKWLEAVRQNYNFPCKIAFVMIKEGDGSVSIISTEIKNKAQVENVKYKNISKATWTSVGSAVLSVGEYDNAEQYLNESKKQTDIWGYALVKR